MLLALQKFVCSVIPQASLATGTRKELVAVAAVAEGVKKVEK